MQYKLRILKTSQHFVQLVEFGRDLRKTVIHSNRDSHHGQVLSSLSPLAKLRPSDPSNLGRSDRLFHQRIDRTVRTGEPEQKSSPI